MILRIVALTIVVCLSLGTLGLANEKSLLPEDTLELSEPDLSVANRRHSAKSHIIIGVTIGLAGIGVAIANDDIKKMILPLV